MATTTTTPPKPTPPKQRLSDLLPTPPRENLDTRFVLGEIIDQIDLIADDFPLVKIAVLKKHLWDINNKNVDPQVHLRGFLHVFAETEVFKNAFSQLDGATKARIEAFMDGKSESEVLGAGGVTGIEGEGQFHLPPSPPSKHHLRSMVEDVKERIEEVLHFGHHEHEGEEKKVEVVKKEEGTEGYPRIFEDEGETRTMEVCFRVF